MSIATSDDGDDPRRREISQVLSRLPPRERWVIELRLAGIKSADIAATMNCSVLLVRVFQVRAVQRIKMLLADEP